MRSWRLISAARQGIDKTPVEKANIVEAGVWKVMLMVGTGTGKSVSFPSKPWENILEHQRDEFLEGGPTESIIVSGIPLEALAVGKTF